MTQDQKTTAIFVGGWLIVAVGVWLGMCTLFVLFYN